MALSKAQDLNFWDRRQHPICRPTRGERGPEARRFLREFLQGAKKVDLDDADWGHWGSTPYSRFPKGDLTVMTHSVQYK